MTYLGQILHGSFLIFDSGSPCVRLGSDRFSWRARSCMREVTSCTTLPISLFKKKNSMAFGVRVPWPFGLVLLMLVLLDLILVYGLMISGNS